ncbi:MAG: transcription termination factor Rho [Marmoricola sp.]|nr:transcription termination factor Rho [Marmoricola sp.]
MTNTLDTSADSGADDATRGRSGGGLNTKLLPELKAIASGLGIKAAGLKKADLVTAIKAAQSGSQPPAQSSSPKQADPPSDASDRADDAGRNGRRRNGAQNEQNPTAASEAGPAPERSEGGAQARGRDRGAEQGQAKQEKAQPDKAPQDKAPQEKAPQNKTPQDKAQDKTQDKPQQDKGQQPKQRTRNQNNDAPSSNGASGNAASNTGSGGSADDTQDRDPSRYADDGEPGGRRNRRRRGRDRERTPGAPAQSSTRPNRGEPDTQILEDDVLTPCAGILDVLDNYAFVRTSGYLPGADDVYVSLSMVRKLGLRRGDAITGQVRQPREGERKEKFNPLVKIDSVNGADPETSRDRVEFSKLTPLYPSERLRMETGHDNLIGRVIDIAAPIGKGQRGLIVSPAKAGKTMIMQSIANSITTNNPECHLMVVLVDERPEEVTDFERSVNGEVISSTFDRPAIDHTVVAELAIERAKRLVELGHDVVVLLDGITRLGRAYNLAGPASGRILSGGVDSAALYPPKKFFGAARNIENGGSLTILATALIESGSKMDEVIFEEFKGTGNMEIRLRRDFADRRIFPAIDAVQSGTRREELLMSEQELAIIWKLRRVLSGLDGQQALELLLERLKKTQNNYEFLMAVQKTTPGHISGNTDE